jgi:DNA (cytosine-5)-methyltransferase 1
LPTPRANEPGSTSPGYGDSLNDFASRITTGYAPKDLLRTPAASEAERGHQTESVARARGGQVTLTGQMKELFPTPNTMEHLPARTGEARERQLYRGGSTSRRNSSGNLREDILDLIPTPTTRDYKDGQQPHKRNGVVQTDTVARAIINSGEVLFPTPKALDGVKGNLKTSQERLDSGHQVDLPNVAIDLLDDKETNWGKFEPAIRRWEQILGRPAPEPTKPDGKDGNHRLSSKFTEWMMGLPEGWITGLGLKRNDELKLAGNGVVPQQAELALRILLEDDNLLAKIQERKKK